MRGAVFIYTPGDIAATQVFGFDGAATSVSTWVIYGVIFVYYLIATVFPIDKIIGRIYPIFGAILLFSAIGVFAGLFIKGYPLINIWDNWNGALVLTGIILMQIILFRSSLSQWPVVFCPVFILHRRRSFPVR